MVAATRRLRSRLGAVTRKVPGLHGALVGLYHFGIFEIWPRLRAPFARGGSRNRPADDLDSFLSLQSVRAVDIRLDTPADASALSASLAEANVSFSEGGWTLYLPPSPELHAIAPTMEQYPVGSGLKILKDLRPPEEASYTPNDMRPAPGAAAVRARTPAPSELLRIAGALANEGISPQVHDLVELVIGDARGTGFVVEHVAAAAPPSPEEHRQFIARLDETLEKGALDVAHGDYRVSKDFREPDCSGNLVRQDDGRCFYIDFQSFRYRDERQAFAEWAHASSSEVLFGPRRLGRKGDYLYQMIPGISSAKRATLDRWEALDALLAEAGVSLGSRATFDIGCNTGLMSYYALSRGAKWAYGWDMPAIAAASKELLNLLGASRWSPFGTEISPNTDFVSFLPSEVDTTGGVLLYLAISNHIGFPDSVSQLPFSYCIYEGHSGQDVEWSIEQLRTSRWGKDLSVLAARTIVDGDSPKRSLILLRRQDN